LWEVSRQDAKPVRDPRDFLSGSTFSLDSSLVTADYDIL